MKILIWFLNIIQFLIVYFLVFYLLHEGIIGGPGPLGLSLESLWPAISIGIAAIPWKYYKRFSLLITSKKMKASTKEVVTEEASSANETKEETIIKRVNKTKPMSILKKILVTIISLIIIITLVFVGVDSYYSYLNNQRDNPESEHFDFNYQPNNDNLTVEVNGLRYLKKDMNLFSGELTGFKDGLRIFRTGERDYWGRGKYETKEKIYFYTNYLNGKLNGKMHEWRSKGSYSYSYGTQYPSDYINGWKTKAFFKNGEKEGLHETWHSNGQLWVKIHYENNLKNGLCEVWNSDGQLTKRLHYENDLKQREWEEWDENGNLIKYWIMKDDIPIEKIVN